MCSEKIFTRYKPIQENLLMILQDLQADNTYNYLTEQNLLDVSRYLNLNKSTVYGAVTYYSMLSLVPRGKHIIRVCVSPICRLKGSESVLKSLKFILGISPGEITEDKLFCLEQCECLGFCFNSPAMLIDEEIYGNLTDKKIGKILSTYQIKEIL